MQGFIKKRTTSLRGQLFLLMATIAVMECIVLLASVFLSGVFTQLDAEAFRFFENDAVERAHSLDSKMGLLIRNITNETNAFNQDAQEIAQEAGIPLEEVYLHGEVYTALAEECTVHLLEFLNANAVSGAFFILNGSNADQEDAGAHSAVYIRDSAPGEQEDNNENLQLMVGPTAVARKYSIGASNRWSLDMQVPEGVEGSFYHNPIAACYEYPRQETVRYGYWAPPGTLLPGSPEAISYTLPIMDRKGNPCGVVGFEIRLTYYTMDYFSNTNLPYNNSFFAITTGTSQTLDTKWVIPGSPLAQAYLVPDEQLVLTRVADTGLYQTQIEGLGEMYCAVHHLTMYSKNSPFIGEEWILTGMVPKVILNETSTQIRNMLFTSMAVTIGIAFVAISLLTYFATRKISGLSRYINEVGPGTDLEIAPTHLTEIDELTAAVTRLNRRVNANAKVTSKMMELTQLPLGGYEISNDAEAVSLTEYIYKLLHLDPGTPVSKERWHEIYEELTSKPAEGYSDVYRYDSSRLEQFRYGDVLQTAKGVLFGQHNDESGEDMYHYIELPEDRQKWLRIIEAPTEGGSVGMILDVTADIEELMRLAHELDYDALTHLYNRTAFKREAFKKIKDNPGKIGAMIFSDLDNLKYINDTFGHEMGDKLITTASDMFRRFAEYGGIVARISGDEFAMFLYGFKSKEEIKEIVRVLYNDFKNVYLITPDGSQHKISYSSGVAWYPEDSTDIADLLKLSDYAMYEAKHSEKGSLFEFNENSYLKNAEMRKSREEITKLIDEGRFHFDFQPVVDLREGVIYGYEALIRSELGYFKTPEDILSTARTQSRLGQLESAIIMKALFLVRKNIDIIGARKIFINSGSGQRLSDRELDTIRQIYKDILHQIILEITEAENDDPQKMSSKLRTIHELGIGIALDDFGEGYSNEMRIVAMQPNIVKIDIPLIHDIHADVKKQEIVQGLVSFCHARGIRVSAEGVENEADLTAVMKMGMDLGQGVLLGKPQQGFEDLSVQVREMLSELRRKESPEE